MLQRKGHRHFNIKPTPYFMQFCCPMHRGSSQLQHPVAALFTDWSTHEGRPWWSSWNWTQLLGQWRRHRQRAGATPRGRGQWWGGEWGHLEKEVWLIRLANVYRDSVISTTPPPLPSLPLPRRHFHNHRTIKRGLLVCIQHARIHSHFPQEIANWNKTLRFTCPYTVL